MTTSAEGLRLLFGLRVRALREERRFTLKAFAERTGLSISYLSEIEQGRKYPKPQKILALATGLGVPYDDLVSLQQPGGPGPVETLLASPLVGGFPFGVFGVRAEDVVRLLTEAPDRANALAHAFVDLGRTYDLQLEDVLLSALRAYQEMHQNYFPDLEDAAVAWRSEHGLPADRPASWEDLAAALVRDFGYQVDNDSLGRIDELAGLRSVFLEGRTPRLLVNPRLMASQRAFVVARELGYCVLKLKDRAVTSSWIQVDSFEQVLNNFRASYFAGALLLDRDALRADVEQWFARRQFSADHVLALLSRRRVTPELLFHRLTELLPRLFGLKDIFFLRFSRNAAGERARLTKFLNLSTSALPHGVGGAEHYCRRWPAVRALEMSVEPATAPASKSGGGNQVVAARTRFPGSGAEFLVLAIGRSLALHAGGLSSVSLGLADGETLRRVVRFAGDPTLGEPTEVGLTCERCPLPRARCAERAAPPSVWKRRQALEAQQEAIAVLRVRATR